MLQARMRGSKEWYRPDRDFMVVHPRLLSQAIAAVTTEIESNTLGEAVETKEDELKRLGTFATELAKIHNACGNREIGAEEMKKRLDELTHECPWLASQVASYVLRISFEMYRHWKLETLPENPDGTVDHTKLTIPSPSPSTGGPC